MMSSENILKKTEFVECELEYVEYDDIFLFK